MFLKLFFRHSKEMTANIIRESLQEIIERSLIVDIVDIRPRVIAGHGSR